MPSPFEPFEADPDRLDDLEAVQDMGRTIEAARALLRPAGERTG